jgi:hypothetical protein
MKGQLSDLAVSRPPDDGLPIEHLGSRAGRVLHTVFGHADDFAVVVGAAERKCVIAP